MRILQKIFLGLLLLCLSQNSSAWRIENDRLYLDYGDTMWDISYNLFGDGNKWNDLWKCRVDKSFDDPRKAYPNMEFILKDSFTQSTISSHNKIDHPGDTIYVYQVHQFGDSSSHQTESINRLVSAIENSPKVSWISKYLIPILAVFIAGLAVYFNRKTFNKSKKHDQLSVKPLLIIRRGWNKKKGKFECYMFNRGVGPLIFKEFVFEYRKQKFIKASDVFKAILKEINMEGCYSRFQETYFTYSLKDLSLLPDNNKLLVRFIIPDDINGKSIYDEVISITYKYKYEDLYENVTIGDKCFLDEIDGSPDFAYNE